ncbi:MAG TPA: DUF6702 family protein [Cyclobacteriaceae bacterium]
MMSLLFSFVLWFHPIHLSITEIDHNEKSKALQMTMRIFIDDLELSIRKKLNEKELDLLEPGNGRTTDNLVREYLADAVKLRVDRKTVKLKYIGHEIEGPAMICYVEIENIKKFTTIEVTNRVILETHDDQSNLVNVNYKDKVKSVRLTNDKPTSSVTF